VPVARSGQLEVGSLSSRWFRAGIWVLAVAGILFGIWLASLRDDYHEQTYEVASLYEAPGAVLPYGVRTTSGKNIPFHNPPNVLPGDVMSERFDALGRVLGTTRNGRYIPKAVQPPKIVFFIPLLIGFGLLLYAALAERSAHRPLAVPGGKMSPLNSRGVRSQAAHEPGITMWTPRHELVAERRRSYWAAGGLAFIDLMWFLMLFQAWDNSTLVLIVVLLVATTAPLVVVANRIRHISGLLRRSRSLSDEQQRADASARQVVDTALAHLARLVDQLAPGPLRESAEDGYRAAEGAGVIWRRLRTREVELRGMIDLCRSARVRTSLAKSLEECVSESADVQGMVEELAAATAQLVTSSDRDAVHNVSRLQAATERITLISQSLDDLDELSPRLPDTKTSSA